MNDNKNARTIMRVPSALKKRFPWAKRPACENPVHGANAPESFLVAIDGCASSSSRRRGKDGVSLKGIRPYKTRFLCGECARKAVAEDPGTLLDVLPCEQDIAAELFRYSSIVEQFTLEEFGDGVSSS